MVLRGHDEQVIRQGHELRRQQFGERGQDGPEERDSREQDRSRLPGCPGQAEYRARQHARDRVRQHVGAYRLPFRGAERERSLAVGKGNGLQRFLAGGDRPGEGQESEREARGKHGKAHLQRKHEQGETEQAVHDGRHARQVADGEPDHASQPPLLRILVQVDGREHAHGHGEHDRDQAHPECPDDGRPDAACRHPPERLGRDELPAQRTPALREDIVKNEQEHEHKQGGREPQDEEPDFLADSPIDFLQRNTFWYFRSTRSDTKLTRNVMKKSTTPITNREW